jgi:predicted membrane-bound spermidine synthase
VKTHIGDGFKFLEDYKDTFDVIITDSSDPEGPAESLFQKPYFQLLFGALKEGGVITTQGCAFSCVSVFLVIWIKFVGFDELAFPPLSILFLIFVILSLNRTYISVIYSAKCR